MGKSIISLLLLLTAWMPGTSVGDELALAESAPDRYVVVKGDTLWDISARFLRDPWRWPDIWGLNKDQIKNPHWIYPGDIILLDFTGMSPRLRLQGVDGATDWRLVVTKLSPSIRKLDLAASAIPSIPMAAIAPFLTKPLVIGKREMAAAPILVAGQENRVVLSAGDTAYAKGVVWQDGTEWNIYRPGRDLVDPDTRELLGREAVHLGELKVSQFGEVSRVAITKSVLEITPGDRLVKIVPAPVLPYIPRAPSKQIKGKVIASPHSSVTEIGPQMVVVLNRGAREGLETGNVLALYRDLPMVRPAGSTNPKERIKLPPERYGIVFVFRVFEKVSYALVMHTTRPVNLLDVVQTP
ncbi:MAG: LysM peptidoglycan-binding domain-containing protein [Burkholderiales bacterium]